MGSQRSVQRSRSRLQRSERCTTPAVLAAAVLQCLCRLVVSQQCPLPLCVSVTETTRRHSRRRRGGALVLVVERCLRPAPDAVAARIFRPCRWPADGRLGRQPPVLKWAGTPPCLRRREESSAPDAVAVASADGPSWCVPVAGWWPSLRQPSAHNALGAWGTARNRRVDGSPTCGAERPAKRREGSVRTTKPAPSEYPHATALGKFERRDKTRTFCLWALGRPTRRVGPLGLVIGL